MRWPTGMEPENSTVYVRNELVMPAPPTRIWRWLCRAERWPEWYGNCRWVRFRDDDGPDLYPGSQFAWKTFGVRVRSQVVTFHRFVEIGWEAAAFGLRAYHGWTFEPIDSHSTRVITEETQVGPLTRIGRWYLRHNLLQEHQHWLEALSRMAQTGDP